MEKYTNYTDPEFLLALAKELSDVPVLTFVLSVMILFYLIVRMLIKVIDNKLNQNKRS